MYYEESKYRSYVKGVIRITYYKFVLYIILLIYFFSLPLDGLTIEYLPFTLSRIISIFLIFIFVFNLLLKKKLYVIKDKSVLALILFLFFATLSIVWSNDVSLFYNTLIFWLMVFSVYSIMELIVSNQLKIRVLLLSYLLGAVTAAIITLNTGPVYFGRYTIYENYNPNTLSPELGIGLVIIAYLSKGLNKINNFILFILFILLIITIVLTQSRNAILALILSFCSVFIIKTVISLKQGVNSYKIKKQIKSILFVSIFIFISFLLIKSAFNLLELNLFNIRRLTTDLGDSSGRDQIWLNYLKIIEENFVVGTGFLNSSVAYLEYFGAISEPHNSFLRVFVDLGVVGFILYLLFFVSLAFKFKFESSYYGNQNYVYLFLIAFMFYLGLANDSFYYRYFWSTWLIAYLIFFEEKNKIVKDDR